MTKALIGINVLVYLIEGSQGGSLSSPSPAGSLIQKWALTGPAVAHGDWWRLITSAFLHANLVHIGFNMLALWIIGRPVESYLGRTRYLALYFVSGLAGSAGALAQTPQLTLGASGAIFGVLGAMLILEWSITGTLAGQAMTMIVLNLAISFSFSGISWGGHIGGLVGGILVMLAFANWRRGHASFGRIGLLGVVGIIAIAVASVAFAYYKARGYA